MTHTSGTEHTELLIQIRKDFIKAAVNGDLTMETLTAWPDGETILLNRNHAEHLIMTLITAKLTEARKPINEVMPKLQGVSAGLSQAGYRRTAEIIDEVIDALQSQEPQL